MKIALKNPPWGIVNTTPELMEALQLFDSNTTKAAKVEAERMSYKGMQAGINKVLAKKFKAAGWDVSDGKFAKNGTVIRVSFRHAVSIGSDILEAYKLYMKGEAKLIVLVVGSVENLRRIAPSQATSMVSVEKLMRELEDLNGLIKIPLLVGEMIPKDL